HPVHRDARQHRRAGALEEVLRAWVLAGEALVLAGLELRQPAAVDGGGDPRRAVWRITFRVSCLIGAGGGAVDRGVSCGEVRCPRPGHARVPGMQATQLSDE